ncbi:hypothetical protein J6590_041765 [Homalodisca vitripennis]|nr:hypothetical protein J6590_041765 [Homalodisca vitripennis]
MTGYRVLLQLQFSWTAGPRLYGQSTVSDKVYRLCVTSSVEAQMSRENVVDQSIGPHLSRDRDPGSGVKCKSHAVPCSDHRRPWQPVYKPQEPDTRPGLRSIMKVLVVLVAACFASSQAAYSGYGGYSGPLASPVVTPNGFLADTPEVAAAKAAHLTEVAKVSTPSGYAPGPYNGAPAYNAGHNHAYQQPAPYNAAPYNPAPAVSPYANNPSVTNQGYLADTPDVAAAKAAHFAEVAKTRTNPGYGPESYDDGSYRPEYDNPNYGSPAAAPQSYAAPNHYAPAAPAHNHYAQAAPSHYNAPAPYNSYAAPSPTGGYHGPLAAPQVTAQGFLAETPEVAAAKAAHFAEFAKAGTHGRYRRSAVLVQTPASTAPLAVHAVAPVHAVAYSAPVYSYAAPHHYSYLRAPSSFAYSVRAW